MSWLVCSPSIAQPTVDNQYLLTYSYYMKGKHWQYKKGHQPWNVNLQGKDSHAYGKRHTQETKDKLSKIREGKNNPMYGIEPWNKGTKGLQISSKKGIQTVRVMHKGYVQLLNPDKDSNIHYIPEHRHIMEKHLGRKLTPNEHVHHLNHIKDDNRLDNLLVMTNSEHITYHKKGVPNR